MSHPFCIFENIDDCLNFGKYKGLSLADVLEINPSYVNWCVKKCDGVHFVLEDNVISQIKEAFPEFPVTSEFENLCCDCYDQYMSDVDESYYICCDEVPTYCRYNGSYAQDEMGFSDDDIDTIFDGDPDAYWNID